MDGVLVKYLSGGGGELPKIAKETGENNNSSQMEMVGFLIGNYFFLM